MTDVPISRQIACATRELAMRRRVYPRWVASSRMTQAEADDEIAAMQAIIDTLKDAQRASQPQGALF